MSHKETNALRHVLREALSLHSRDEQGGVEPDDQKREENVVLRPPWHQLGPRKRHPEQHCINHFPQKQVEVDNSVFML